MIIMDDSQNSSENDSPLFAFQKPLVAVQETSTADSTEDSLLQLRRKIDTMPKVEASPTNLSSSSSGGRYYHKGGAPQLGSSVVCVDDTPSSGEIDQVMVIDSSMETADESSQKKNLEKRYKYTVTKSLIERYDIQVEEFLNGEFLKIKGYSNENILKRDVETFEETSSPSTSILSENTSPHFSADVSASRSSEPFSSGNSGREIIKNVLEGVAVTSRLKAKNRIKNHLGFESDSSVLLPLEIRSLDSSGGKNLGPKEFPKLGSSPHGDSSGDNGERGFFKHPDLPLPGGGNISRSSQFEAAQLERLARISSSTRISEGEMLSLIGLEEVSSIRRSSDIVTDPRFVSSDASSVDIFSGNSCHLENSAKNDEFSILPQSSSSELLFSNSDVESLRRSDTAARVDHPCPVSSDARKSSVDVLPDIFPGTSEENIDYNSKKKKKEFPFFPESSSGGSLFECKEASYECVNDLRKDSEIESTDIVPPTEPEASDREVASTTGRGGRRFRTKRARFPIRRYSMLRRLSTIASSPNLEEDSRVLSKVSSNEPTLEPGALVYARWIDSHFYPGRVDKILSGCDRSVVDDTAANVVILFDDGYHHQATRGDVVSCNLVAIGAVVMAQRSEEEHLAQAALSTPRGRRAGWSEPCTVVGHTDRGDGTKSYVVKFDDGVEVCLQRQKVTLTIIQARRIFGSLLKFVDLHRTQPISPDVTTDNVVMGKRKRRPTTPLSQSLTGEVSVQMGSLTTPSRKRAHHSAGKSKLAGSMPKMRKKHTALKEHFNPCSNVVLCSPKKHHRPAGRPAKRALDLEKLVTARSDIFSGLTFLVTHVWKSSFQLEREWRLMSQKTDGLSESSQSGSSFGDSAMKESWKLMNRDLIINLIKTGGGILLDEFDMDSVSERKDSCYLISDSPQRTIKYLSCLAFGIPCVSYQWIEFSCTLDKLEDYRLYLLPIGYSIKQNLILTRDYDLQHHPLIGLTAILHLSEESSDSAWKKVLVAAGCRVIETGLRGDEAVAHQLRNLSINRRTTFLITDSTFLCDKLSQVALASGVSVVTTEWVVQSIIEGHAIDPNESPQYRPQSSIKG